MPFSYLYGWILRLRHYLYDNGVFKSNQFELPIIRVGNLSVGGTGKTPHVEYLVRMLKDEYKVAMVSRGYQRKSKGFQLATKASTTDQLGDEPYQIFQKYPDIFVAVDGNRSEAIKFLKEANVEVYLMDDALQHRQLNSGLSVMLTEFSKPFYKDNLLPTGNLRDLKSRSQSMDIIVVTKCPEDITKAEQLNMINQIKPSNIQDVFFTAIDYLDIEPVFDEQQVPLPNGKKYDNILLFTGIADNQKLLEKVNKMAENVVLKTFADHHDYTGDQIARLIKIFDSFADGQNIILTTEKDAVKLQHMKLMDEVKETPWCYLPIAIKFVEREEQFQHLILDYVRKNK